jgi:hypothetical protein
LINKRKHIESLYAFFVYITLGLKRKVLIISYYWPPSGGISVLRCLRFAKYLAEFGMRPIVYTAYNPCYVSEDSFNFKDIPLGIDVIKYPIFEPYYFFNFISGRTNNKLNNPVYIRDRKLNFIDKLSIWMRGNVFIPDAKVFWVLPSIIFLVNFFRKKEKLEAIISDGPPHTNNVIGSILAKRFKTNHIVDFQDPWTQVDYMNMMFVSKISMRLHSYLESYVIGNASAVCTVSKSWKNDLEELGAKNVEVVYYGYEESDFGNLESKIDSNFSIVHAGLLGYDRLPLVFLKALRDLCELDCDFANSLQLIFIGKIDIEVKEFVIRNNLLDNFIHIDNLNRDKVLERISKSHLLLLLLNKASNVKGRIPGKLFEYLRVKRPILSLGKRGTDVEEIINYTHSGYYCDYDDYNAIKEVLIERFRMYRKINSSFIGNNIDQFDSKNQVEKVLKIIDCLNGKN